MRRVIAGKKTNSLTTPQIKRSILSLIVLGCLTSILLVASARSVAGPGAIPVSYIWVKLTSVLSAGGAILSIGLRLFRVIHPSKSFPYTFLAITNTILGIGGVLFYVIHKINLIGLHTLLLNLLIGIVLLADIFFFDVMIRKE